MGLLYRPEGIYTVVSQIRCYVSLYKILKSQVMPKFEEKGE